MHGAALLIIAVGLAAALPNGLGQTPPLSREVSMAKGGMSAYSERGAYS